MTISYDIEGGVSQRNCGGLSAARVMHMLMHIS